MKRNKLVRGLVTSLCLFGMSSAGIASAEPACVVGQSGYRVEAGFAYCEVQAFGESFAYRIDLQSPAAGGGFNELQVTRVGNVPGKGAYDCDAEHVMASVVSWTNTNGVSGNRQDNLTLNCNEPVTLLANEGQVFNSAKCHIIYGCQSAE